MTASALYHVQHHRGTKRTDKGADRNRKARTPTIDMQAGGIRRETGVVAGGDRIEQCLPQGAAKIAVIHAK